MNPNDPNLPMLEAVVGALGALSERFVFVGGCATGLLTTDPAATPIRATQDVDVIVEAVTLLDYHTLERELEGAGFHRDRSPEAPICRWVVAGCLVDVMPTDEEILGFGNRWFTEAIQSAESIQLPRGPRIRLVTSPMFLATKLEAFRVRGAGDYQASHDLEDVVTLVDGRPTIAADVTAAVEPVRAYIASEMRALMQTEAFRESLYGHVPGDEASQARVRLIRQRLEELCAVA